jgi:hypothetical protein
MLGKGVRDEQISLLAGSPKPRRFCCGTGCLLIFNFIVLGAFASIILTESTHYFNLDTVTNKTDALPNFVVVQMVRVFILVTLFCSYIFYTIGYCCIQERRYISNAQSAESATIYLQKLVESPPLIQFDVDCYHYETTSTTNTDSQGNTTTSTSESKVSSYTHREVLNFNNYSWKDETVLPSFQDAGSSQIFRVNIDKILLVDEKTQKHVTTRKETLYRENQHRDTYCSSTFHFSVEGFRDRLLVVPNNNIPWYLSSPVYFLLSIFGFWFVAKLIIKATTTRDSDVTIKKQGTLQPSLTSDHLVHHFN